MPQKPVETLLTERYGSDSIISKYLCLSNKDMPVTPKPNPFVSFQGEFWGMQFARNRFILLTVGVLFS
jgi:hypothetical protein